MPYDLVIKNGVLVDGSGLPRYHADIAVQHGRVVSIGRIRERGREVVDAEGMVVSPGFIDGHTHMDAQVFGLPRAGIAATIVSGEVVLRDGKHTGALPGRLLRSPHARRAGW